MRIFYIPAIPVERHEAESDRLMPHSSDLRLQEMWTPESSELAGRSGVAMTVGQIAVGIGVSVTELAAKARL